MMMERRKARRVWHSSSASSEGKQRSLHDLRRVAALVECQVSPVDLTVVGPVDPCMFF